VSRNLQRFFIEPWRLTRGEYLRTVLTPKGLRSRKKKIGNLTLKQWHAQQHEGHVGQAVMDRKPVPEEVLADYPGVLAWAREEGYINPLTEDDEPVCEHRPERLYAWHADTPVKVDGEVFLVPTLQIVCLDCEEVLKTSASRQEVRQYFRKIRRRMPKEYTVL